MDSVPQAQFARERTSGSEASSACVVDRAGWRPDYAANDTRVSDLARAIELEIIPRLMVAHRAVPDPVIRSRPAEQEIGDETIRAFAQRVLSHEDDMSFNTIEQLRSQRVSVQRIYLELLAPTARYLGHLWDEDLCSFTDVTVGLGRLQRLLRELGSGHAHEIQHPVQGRRVLLLPTPGEQHTFGLVMLAEFFRSAGWDVTGGAWTAEVDVVTQVGIEWFDVVGFSIGTAGQLKALSNRIAAARHASCNRGLIILVGGPIFGLHPQYADDVGADGMTMDAREAPALAQSLVDRDLRREGIRV